MNNKAANVKSNNEAFNILLQELLRIEDNKYCVDCDAKGPRWASWNIGVFLCIRCAGIHRNLGVHISKVKSVNLDTWTLNQLAAVWSMGNSLGRAIYEARLPDNFRRPQTDSALETFIRAKYEHKRYMLSEYAPSEPDMSALKKDLDRIEQSLKKRTGSTPVNVIQPQQPNKKDIIERPLKSSSSIEPKSIPANNAVIDLLNFNVTPTTTTGSSASGIGDAFNIFDSGKTIQHQQTSSVNNNNKDNLKPNEDTTKSIPPSSSLVSDLFGIELSNNNNVTASNTPWQTSQPLAAGGTTNSSDPFTPNNKTVKESILALYHQAPSQPTSFTGVQPPYPTNTAQLNSANYSSGSYFQGMVPGTNASCNFIPTSKPFADFQSIIPSSPIGQFGSPNSNYAGMGLIGNKQPFPVNTNDTWANPGLWSQTHNPAFNPAQTSFQTSPTNTNAQWWSMNQDMAANMNPISQSATFSSGFQQHYLSQVQNQLSSLQLNGEFNKPFP